MCICVRMCMCVDVCVFVCVGMCISMCIICICICIIMCVGMCVYCFCLSTMYLIHYESTLSQVIIFGSTRLFHSQLTVFDDSMNFFVSYTFPKIIKLIIVIMFLFFNLCVFTTFPSLSFSYSVSLSIYPS